MKIEIKSEKKNPLLKRTEIYFTIDHAGETTPKRGAVLEELVKITKAKKDTIVLDNVESVFGKGVSEGYAKVYESKEIAQEIEPEFILKRNGIQKPAYVKPEAAPAEGAAEAPKE